MKKIIVLGHTPVTVSVMIEVPDNAVLTESEIYAKAVKKFGGIRSYLGNGGNDKLIGVEGDGESISADESVTFDDFLI